MPSTAETLTAAKATLKLLLRAARSVGFCKNLLYHSHVKPVHCDGDGDLLKLKMVSTAIGRYIYKNATKLYQVCQRLRIRGLVDDGFGAEFPEFTAALAIGYYSLVTIFNK